jgi:hypothetical protein
MMASVQKEQHPTSLVTFRVEGDHLISGSAISAAGDGAADLVQERARQLPEEFWRLATTLFNHQTHHRGQASTLLSQSGLDIGVTDLLEWIPEYPNATQ